MTFEAMNAEVEAPANTTVATQQSTLAMISANDAAMVDSEDDHADATGDAAMRAVAYIRVSSATNADGDSMVRQFIACNAHAARAGLTISAVFMDAAVKGADPVDQRGGFSALLAFCADNGVHTILVENASRFARDLVVQEVGYRMLCDRGYDLVASDDPDAFAGDTPTAVMVRQILGAVAQFEKAGIVQKLRGARERASAALGAHCNGRGRIYRAGRPDLIAAAKGLAADRSLRDVATELASQGYVTAGGKAFSASQVSRLIAA